MSDSIKQLSLNFRIFCARGKFILTKELRDPFTILRYYRQCHEEVVAFGQPACRNARQLFVSTNSLDSIFDPCSSCTIQIFHTATTTHIICTTTDSITVVQALTNSPMASSTLIFPSRTSFCPCSAFTSTSALTNSLCSKARPSGILNKRQSAKASVTSLS